MVRNSPDKPLRPVATSHAAGPNYMQELFKLLTL